MFTDFPHEARLPEVAFSETVSNQTIEKKY